MSDLNAVHLIGRLGKPPESKSLPSGQTVCNFSIAVSEQFKDKTSGEKREVTNWINIVVWGKLAEVCGQYLVKGSQVYIGGKIQVRKYEKDGSTRYATEVVADKLQMLGGKPATAQGAAPAAPVEQPAAKGFDDDDTPF